MTLFGFSGDPIAALFADVDHFREVRSRTDFERPGFHARVFGHDLDGVIQVAGFEDEDAADLFLRFRVRAVGDGNLAVRPSQGCGGFRALQGFTAREVPIRPQLVVVGEAFPNF